MSQVSHYHAHNDLDEPVASFGPDYGAAERYARHNECAVLEYVYEFTKTNLIWTPNDETTWPPPCEDHTPIGPCGFTPATACPMHATGY